MNIAIFSDCYLPTINGVVTSIELQIEALRNLGHQVDLFCPHYPGVKQQEAGTWRLSAFPFPFHKAEQVAFCWPPAVLRQALTQAYDVVHLQTPFSVGLLGLAVSVWRGIPRIFHHHTLWEEYVDYLPLPKKVVHGASIAYCRWIAQRCQAVISPSAQVKKRFAAQGVTRPIAVIPTGIRVTDFMGGQVKVERGEGEDICLYVGRLAFEKSIDVVVRVFERVHRERPNARLWLVGDGPARKALEAQVAQAGLENVVRFWGFVQREELKDIMATAKVFLFASLTETQGLVLLEAQAGGVPVVAVRASGVDEAVNPGVTGFLVEPNDEEAMTRSALTLLESMELHHAFSLAARSWSASFGIGQMGESLVHTYQLAIETA